MFLAAPPPRGLRDLSSPTRERTRAPRQWKRTALTTGPQGIPSKPSFQRAHFLQFFKCQQVKSIKFILKSGDLFGIG